MPQFQHMWFWDPGFQILNQPALQVQQVRNVKRHRSVPFGTTLEFSHCFPVFLLTWKSLADLVSLAVVWTRFGGIWPGRYVADFSDDAGDVMASRASASTVV